MKEAFNKIKQQTRQGMVWFQKQWISAKKLASDGCTGIPDLGLTECCEQHDADYTTGSGITRFDADYDLMCCVIRKAKKQYIWENKAFYYALSVAIFIGIRLTGWLNYQKEEEKK